MRRILLFMILGWEITSSFRIQVNNKYYQQKSASSVESSIMNMSPEWVSLLIETVNANNVLKREKLSIETLACALQTWETALLSGNLPDEQTVWPSEPLQSKIRSTFLDLQLPKLALRHNDLVGAVLRGLIKLSIEFSTKVKETERDMEILPNNDDLHDQNDVNEYIYENTEYEEQPSSSANSHEISEEDIASLLALSWSR